MRADFRWLALLRRLADALREAFEALECVVDEHPILEVRLRLLRGGGCKVREKNEIQSKF